MSDAARLVMFITVVICVYTLMHLVVYWGVRPLIFGHRACASILWAWMAAMVLSPFAMRMLERADQPQAARAVALVGFTWMGFVFLAFVLFTLLGGLHLLWLGVSKYFTELPPYPLYGPQTALVVLTLVAAVGIYGVFEARDLAVEKVSLSSAKIKAGTTVRIAQISDVHLGVMNKREVLAPIVSLLEELKPDMIVATGDVVDAELNHLTGLAELLAALKAPLGKYAIYGNHEHYAGVGASRSFLAEAGFRLLLDEGVKAGEIFVVGVDDVPRADEPSLLKAAGGAFTLFLKHKPLVKPETLGLFDLQLSGHTHAGQIYPFRHITARAFPMVAGLYEPGGESRVYVSRGTGTWGPPMRVGARPEITLIEITGR